MSSRSTFKEIYPSELWISKQELHKYLGQKCLNLARHMQPLTTTTTIAAITYCNMLTKSDYAINQKNVDFCVTRFLFLTLRKFTKPYMYYILQN